MNGKGDARRPGDAAAYRDGWDRVFGPAAEHVREVAPRKERQAQAARDAYFAAPAPAPVPLTVYMERDECPGIVVVGADGEPVRDIPIYWKTSNGSLPFDVPYTRAYIEQQAAKTGRTFDEVWADLRDADRRRAWGL